MYMLPLSNIPQADGGDGEESNISNSRSSSSNSSSSSTTQQFTTPYLRLYSRYEHKMSSGLVLAKPAFILVQQNLQRTLHRRIHTHSTEYTAYIAQENACTLQRRILAFILVQQNLRCTFDKRIQGITIKQIYANSYVCP